MNVIFLVFRKELLDVLRDRKTLSFMILLPVLVVPLLTVGASRLGLALLKSNALAEVVIAAAPEDRQRYTDLVHAKFIHSDLGRNLRLAHSPLLRALVSEGFSRELVEALPPGLFTDPEVFARWLESLTVEARRLLDENLYLGAMRDLPNPDAVGLPTSTGTDMSGLQASISDFYFTEIQGLGLVRFVDPAELAAVPPQREEQLPAPLIDIPHGQAIHKALMEREIQGLLRIDGSADEVIGGDDRSVSILLIHDASQQNSAEAARRFRHVANSASTVLLSERVTRSNLPRGFAEPVAFRENGNIATPRRIALTLIGGMLPYLVLTFAILGGMYPALDLGVGEKERLTIESLLLAPVNRWQIALGKLLMIFTASVTAALLGVVSLALSLRLLIPPAILQFLDISIDAGVIIPLVLLIIPPALAVSSLFLAVSIFARSFKEAQNYLAPLPLLIILPAGAALVPGLEMSNRLASILLVNVSLLGRDLLRGDVNVIHYGLTYISCTLLAVICLAIVVWLFHREEVLFRV